MGSPGTNGCAHGKTDGPPLLEERVANLEEWARGMGFEGREWGLYSDFSQVRASSCDVKTRSRILLL
jgi:hypothetical protein